MKGATEKEIIDLHNKGVRVVDILAQIDNKSVSRKDVYNLLQRHKRKE